MADIPGEINSIDFGSMIGAPLQAMIEAQARSALTTVDFIKTVGFRDEDGKLVPNTVSFQYNRATFVPGTDTTPSRVTQVPTSVEVPLLTIVPIPFTRLEEGEIDFNVKITSMQRRETESATEVGGKTSVGFTGFGVSAKLDVSASYRKTSSSQEETHRTYQLGVRLRVVQDDLPDGLERLLSMLEQGVLTSAGNTNTPVT